jgi:hypothetical protein
MLQVLLPYKTIIVALLLPGVVILGFTAFQAKFMQQQIMNDYDIIDRCYAVLKQPSNPPVADALKECQQLQEVTTDQEGFLTLIYGIMTVGGALIAGGTVFGFSYFSKLKGSAE